MKKSAKLVFELLLRGLVRTVLAVLPLAGLTAAFAVGDEGGDDDEEDENEGAQTIVAMPTWMIEEMAKKRQEAMDKRAALAEASPEPEDIQVPSMSEGPQEAEGDEPETPEVSVETEGPTDEVDLGTAQTMMFDPAAAVEAKEQAEPAPPEAEEDLGSAQTLMFDPQDAVKAQEQVEEAREQTADPVGETAAEEPAAESAPADDAIGETAVYSADEVARLRDQAAEAAGSEAGDEVDGEAKTMMYMPAQDPATPAEAPADISAQSAGDGPSAEPQPPEDDAHAPTRVYMEAVGDGGDESTMAYSPEDREKLLEKMAKKGVDGAVAEAEQSESEEVDTAGATAVYSAEESAQFKDAYDLLRKPGDAAETPEVTEARTETAPEMERVQEPITVSTMSPVDASRGVGAGTVIFLLALLAVAGAATAVILHLFGVVVLPLDLPTLDL